MEPIYRDRIYQLLTVATILSIAAGIGYIFGYAAATTTISATSSPCNPCVCVAPPGVVYADDLDFMVWSHQNVTCGSGCYIDADHHCNITCGDSCYIDCWDECVVRCGSVCNVAHGKNCSITHGTDCNAWDAYLD